MENIKAALQQIEKENGVKILYAIESGSRAWGFPSPDSDFDVRFIYIHNKNWYLGLADKKDTIESMQGELDITGWDLKKSLILLKKSNVAMIEKFQSPIVYFQEESFSEAMKSILHHYYSPTAVFSHHYSLAKKFWEEIKEAEVVKVKRYFYLIRSLLTCNWVVNIKILPPMDIEGLMNLISVDEKFCIRELIKLKATVNEKYLHQKDGFMDDFALQLFSFIEPFKNQLGLNDSNYILLDQFFLKTINENVNN
jgi:predicted nucleotidyltransferase